MFVAIISVQVKPEFLDAFREATIENASNSIQEPGVVRFDFLQQADDPTKFVLYEVYRDADAPAKHRETAHFKKWFATAADMMAQPRTRLTFSNIFPLDANW